MIKILPVMLLLTLLGTLGCRSLDNPGGHAQETGQFRVFADLLAGLPPQTIKSLGLAQTPVKNYFNYWRKQGRQGAKRQLRDLARETDGSRPDGLQKLVACYTEEDFCTSARWLHEALVAETDPSVLWHLQVLVVKHDLALLTWQTLKAEQDAAGDEGKQARARRLRERLDLLTRTLREQLGDKGAGL
jgi:hypothetical protein